MIFAVTMVRDELDILPWTLAHMLDQVDHVIVADNRSVDGTRQYLDTIAAGLDPRTMTSVPSLRGRITVHDDPEPGYYQDDKMTALAHEAFQMGARWVVPFDADEAWYRLDLLRTDEADDYDIVTARPFVFVPTSTDPVDEPDPIARMLYRCPTPEPHPKVAFRAHPYARIHMGNHGVDNVGHRVAHHRLGCRHYQFRSLDQLRRKIRNGMEAYTAAGQARANYGSYWRDLASLEQTGELETWWQRYVRQALIFDPDA